VRHALTALLLAFFALASPAVAQTFPPLTGRVVDDAHILTPAQVADLTSKSEALEAQTGRQLVVATVPSLQGYPIEDFGYRLGRAWGIGQKGKDNGVVLLVAPGERRVRIAVGYGLEGLLTDQRAARIVNDMLPYFRSGNGAQAISVGVKEIDSVLRSDLRRPQYLKKAA